MATTEPSPTPGYEAVHDHRPRHGGVVGMSGSRHVEAVLLPSGVLRVYLTDLRRTPLALDGVTGSAMIKQGDMRVQLPLVVHGPALEAQLPVPAGPTADVRIEILLRGEPLLIDFALPVPPPR